jgi:hypothetical protein
MNEAGEEEPLQAGDIALVNSIEKHQYPVRATRLSR